MSDFWSDCSSTSILHVSERRMLWRACASALARLRGCAGSPVPSLVAYVISTIISWAGSNNSIFKVPCRINARLFYFYLFIYLFIYYWFNRPSRLFHSFWTESDRKWEIPEKNHLTPASRTWLVSHMTRAKLEPTAVRWSSDLER